MRPDADKKTDEMLNKLRKLKGFCPLTPEEADAAFEESPDEPISADDRARMLKAITSEENVCWTPRPSLDWMEEENLEQIECDAMQLHRNKGDDDPEALAEEDALRKELLENGDDTEEKNGMA
jgi:hypothetical protein